MQLLLRTSLMVIMLIPFSIRADTVMIDGVELALIKKGNFDTTKPTLLLLSGPTDNWHSDLGWWILGQNFLAQEYPTIALERANQIFSQSISQPSYTDFGKRLVTFIKKQNSEIIIVAFASSNLSVQLALQDPETQKKVKGIVLLDPDVLTRHSIEHYSQDTEKYRQNWKQLSDYITSGKYKERAESKVAMERKHLESIITEKYKPFMDWDLYTAYEQQRKKDSHQLNKFKEITRYKADLEKAYQKTLSEEIPVVILDSDFESGYLASIKDQETKESIIKWREQGKKQFFEMARKNPCSAYWPIDSQEHLLTFTELEKISRAVKRIEKCQH